MLSQEQNNVSSIDVIKVFTTRNVREFGEQSNHWIIDWVKITYKSIVDMRACL